MQRFTALWRVVATAINEANATTRHNAVNRCIYNARAAVAVLSAISSLIKGSLPARPVRITGEGGGIRGTRTAEDLRNVRSGPSQ